MTEKNAIAEPTLAFRIAKIVHEVGWIGKDGTNTTQKYKFASASSVFHAVNEACFRHGVAVTADVIKHENFEIKSSSGTAGIRTEILMQISLCDVVTGECTVAKFPGIGIDYGDKSANKAITSTRKYGLLGMLGIPTGDDPDPDEKDPEPQQLAPSITVLFQRWQAKFPGGTGLQFKDWVVENTRLRPSEQWRPNDGDRHYLAEALEQLL